MLSDLKQLTPVSHAMFSCIDVVYKVGRFSSFDGNNIASSFSSVSRVKKKPTEQLQALRRVSES